MASLFSLFWWIVIVATGSLLAQSSSRVGLLQESSSVYNSAAQKSVGNTIAFEAQFAWAQNFRILARSHGSYVRHPEAESYRFQFGPGLLYSFRWVDIALRTSFFRENGAHRQKKDPIGRSQGLAWEIGWERNLQLSPRLWVNWGGQWNFYTGRYRFESDGQHAHHRGYRRSIELGLKMALSS